MLCTPGSYLAPSSVLALAHDVAAAMLHLHSEGIVHGEGNCWVAAAVKRSTPVNTLFLLLSQSKRSTLVDSQLAAAAVETVTPGGMIVEPTSFGELASEPVFVLARAHVCLRGIPTLPGSRSPPTIITPYPQAT